MAFGLWIREPSLGWALAACGAAVLVVVAAFRAKKVGAWAAAAVGVAAALTMVSTSLRVRAVEQRWLETRESLIERASERLAATLGSAVDLTRSLAERGAAISASERSAAFAEAGDIVSGQPPEHGIVVHDEVGNPWVWAGTHRLRPGRGAFELTARITPFYVLLEAHRQSGIRTAVSQVVLAAGSAVPDQGGTLAAQFVEETGVGLEFYLPGAAPLAPDMFDFDFCLGSCAPEEGAPPPDTLFSVRTVPPTQGWLKLDLIEQGTRWGSLMVLGSMALLVVFGGAIGRWAGVFGIVGLLTLTPAGQGAGLGSLFSPAIYFSQLLGPLSASAGALGLAAAVVLLVELRVLRRPPRRTLPRAIGAGLAIVAAPWVMWKLAQGITPPATGLGVDLWLSWQVPLTLVGAALVLGAAVLAGPANRRWAVWAAAGSALLLGALGIATWQPTGDWPWWFGLLWIPAAGVTLLSPRRAPLLAAAALVVGTGAALLTWDATVHGRLLLAERDAQRLDGGDPVAIGFLDRFSMMLENGPPPLSAASLYAEWRTSPLSEDDYPAVLATWSAEGGRIAALELAELGLERDYLAALADTARGGFEPLLRALELRPGIRYVSATPFPDGTVVTVGVAPRSQLIRPVRVGRFLRGERRLVAPYEMFLMQPVADGSASGGPIQWRRDGWQVRATRALDLAQASRHLHVSVPLRDPSQLLVRGTLIVFLDVILLALLGIGAVALSGAFERRLVIPAGLRFRSYRARLTLALAAFFVIPTLGFAAWSIGRLQVDTARSRDLLIQQTLSDAAGTARQLGALPLEEVGEGLRDLSDRLSADLLWYEGGVLMEASTTVLAELGLLDPYLAPALFEALTMNDEPEVTADAAIGGQPTRVGYRNLGGVPRAATVLAEARLLDAGGIRREQEDLAYGLLLVTLLGLGGAAGLAALAARSLSRPVQSLRVAAVAVGSGEEPPPFDADVPAEFVSVVDAFERMASDVEASQRALEAARRRTATVLSNVATGVVAVDRTMLVTIANPRASELLRATLDASTPIAAATAPEWVPLWEWVMDFMRQGAELDTREFSIGARRIRAQVAALQTDPRGCVVALDDMTELTHAVRVLAWGELARQIAHEIKNPLTPIRLGVQHLQRARRHGRADFDATLERTAHQILAEIERLDAIARAFSRFGAPQTGSVPLVHADVAAIAEDAAALYSLSGEARVSVVADGAVEALVRPDEVKEVLINLVENARDAGSAEVTITVKSLDEGVAELTVEDDGCGITGEHMIHIFEPQFSTTSSGTGLGLAICKRLVEGWGGTIEVESEKGRGTRVRVVLGRAEKPFAGSGG